MAENLEKIPSADTINKDLKLVEEQYNKSLKTLQKVETEVSDLKSQRDLLKVKVEKGGTRIEYFSKLNSELTTKLEDVKRKCHQIQMIKNSNETSAQSTGQNILEGSEMQDINNLSFQCHATEKIKHNNETSGQATGQNILEGLEMQEINNLSFQELEEKKVKLLQKRQELLKNKEILEQKVASKMEELQKRFQ